MVEQTDGKSKDPAMKNNTKRGPVKSKPKKKAARLSVAGFFAGIKSLPKALGALGKILADPLHLPQNLWKLLLEIPLLGFILRFLLQTLGGLAGFIYKLTPKPVKKFFNQQSKQFNNKVVQVLVQKFKGLNSNYQIAIGILGVLVVWMLSGMLARGDAEVIDVSQRTNNKIRSVLVQEFYQQPSQRKISISGTSFEDRMVSIKSEVSTFVEEIHSEEGAEVDANYSLMTLEQEEATARLKQAQSEENRARLEFQSQSRLLTQGLASRATLDQASAAHESAKAARALAEKRYRSTEVHPPFAGRVEKIYVAEGDFLQVGQALADVFDYDPIVVIGYLSEIELPFVNTANEVTANFRTGETMQGRVSYVAKTPDRASRTYEVRVEVPNPDGSLSAGTTVELEFDTGTIRATRIPASLMNIDAEGEIGVKGIDANDQVNFYPIEIIKAETNDIWVDGIPNGAKVITRGFGFVKQGETVDVRFEKGQL